MGQGKSSIINAKLYDSADYNEENSFNEERYGQMKLLVSKATQQKFAEITKTLNDESVLDKRVEELSFRQQLAHPNLIKLVSFNSQKKDEFCSSFYKLGLFYEYFSNNLRTEIQDRQKVRAAYREGELWYILHSLLSVVLYLKTMNVTHGDIRPYNIIVTPEGYIKLGEIFIHSQPLSSYSQLLHNSLEEYYISPQLFRSLKEYKINPIFDANKSEVFSIGMSVLEAATLENVSRVCYDKENFVINQEELNRLLNQVRTQYSYPLYTFLQKLLVEDEQQRASVEDLVIELSQSFVQSQITNGITTIEIINQSSTNIGGQQIEETTYVEEKVVRSANPARESHYQEKTYEIPASTYTTTTYVSPVIETSTYQNDDLNARIQAVLAMSKETIAKYGSSNISYTPSTYNTTSYTTTNYVAPVETRTYVVDNTNQAQTQNYTNLENIEEVIKRSKKEQNNAENTVEQVSYNINNVEPVRSSQQLVSSTYTPLTNSYNINYTTAQVPTYTTSTYVPTYTQNTYVTNNVPFTSNVPEYQTSSSALNFNSAEEREAYISKIINDAKLATSSLNNNNYNNQYTTTYTTYAENQPATEQVNTYTTNNYTSSY